MKARHKTVLITRGHVIDPSTRTDAELDVLLRDGEVAEIAPRAKIRGSAEEKFDAHGLIVAPGFIDMHVHLREPGQSYKETIATGSAAAAAGGFTSVCAMPNTAPVADTAEIIRWMQAPERGAVVNLFPIAAATVGSQGERLTDYRALRQAGAVAVTDDGRPILEDDIMAQALRAAASAGIPVVQHAEDTRLTANCTVTDGLVSFRLGLRGMSSEAEASVVERDINLARQANAQLHVAHVSTAAALKAIRRGKKNRVRVTCEVTPHHFTLADEDMPDYDTRFKMNPPLRTAADREALLAALIDGTIDAVATDHAPHARYEKDVEFDIAPFGVTGLETALGLAISRLHRARRVPLVRIIELFSTHPARILGLRGRGSLAKGSRADVTIFDPAKRWTFDASKSLSKSRNTPFDGAQIVGKAVATIVSGAFVYRSE